MSDDKKWKTLFGGIRKLRDPLATSLGGDFVVERQIYRSPHLPACSYDLASLLHYQLLYDSQRRK